MKKTFRLLPLLLISLLFFFCSPPSEKQVNEAELIIGKWELLRAEMNGQDRTDRMRGTYFTFIENGVLSSNFNPEGATAEYGYELNEENGEIIVSGGFNPVFSTNFKGKDQLILVTSLNRNKFRFFLQRADNESMEENESQENEGDVPEM